jgi:two-component SAPR family response regulator
MLAKLGELRNQPKYVHEPGTSYNGMWPETDRQRAEAQLNELIDRLHQNLATAPMKKSVLGEFSNTLAQFEPVDTEDRERLCRYLEEIMNILGIESSGGLLNRWLYGPILGSALRSRRQTN